MRLENSKKQMRETQRNKRQMTLELHIPQTTTTAHRPVPKNDFLLKVMSAVLHLVAHC